MNRRTLNRIAWIVPLVFSGLAFAVVLLAVATGWDKGDPDEGPPAHIFQLLILAEAPFILLYLFTAEWRAVRQTARPLIFQAAGLILALGSVAFFHL
jgi:hypothetical protein